MRKKNPSVQSVYVKDEQVWNRARQHAEDRGMSLSAYVERALKAENVRLEERQLPLAANQ